MIIRMNGIPVSEAINVHEVSDTLVDIAHTPINVGVDLGGHFIGSADLNPVNAIEHIINFLF